MAVGSAFVTLSFGALVNHRQKIAETIPAPKVVIQRVIIKKYYLPASVAPKPRESFERASNPLVRFRNGQIGRMDGSGLFPTMREIIPGIYGSCALHCDRRDNN